MKRLPIAAMIVGLLAGPAAGQTPQTGASITLAE
jgi:hypothetical protein